MILDFYLIAMITTFPLYLVAIIIKFVINAVVLNFSDKYGNTFIDKW